MQCRATIASRIETLKLRLVDSQAKLAATITLGSTLDHHLNAETAKLNILATHAPVDIEWSRIIIEIKGVEHKFTPMSKQLQLSIIADLKRKKNTNDLAEGHIGAVISNINSSILDLMLTPTESMFDHMPDELVLIVLKFVFSSSGYNTNLNSTCRRFNVLCKDPKFKAARMYRMIDSALLAPPIKWWKRDTPTRVYRTIVTKELLYVLCVNLGTLYRRPIVDGVPGLLETAPMNTRSTLVNFRSRLKCAGWNNVRGFFKLPDRILVVYSAAIISYTLGKCELIAISKPREVMTVEASACFNNPNVILIRTAFPESVYWIYTPQTDSWVQIHSLDGIGIDDRVLYTASTKTHLTLSKSEIKYPAGESCVFTSAFADGRSAHLINDTVFLHNAKDSIAGLYSTIKKDGFMSPIILDPGTTVWQVIFSPFGILVTVNNGILCFPYPS
jgi:hypothetical protein